MTLALTATIEPLHDDNKLASYRLTAKPSKSSLARLPKDDDGEKVATLDIYNDENNIVSEQITKAQLDKLRKLWKLERIFTHIPVAGVEPTATITWPEFKELAFDNFQIDPDKLDEIVAHEKTADLADALANISTADVENNPEDEDFHGPLFASRGHQEETIFVSSVVEEPTLVLRPGAKSTNSVLTLVIPSISYFYAAEIQWWLHTKNPENVLVGSTVLFYLENEDSAEELVYLSPLPVYALTDEGADLLNTHEDDVA